jgi:hypothetical protein
MKLFPEPGGGAQFELRDPHARREFAVLAVQPFIIDDQTEELGLAEVLVVAALESILERVGHAEEFHGDEFFVRLFVQHIETSPDFLCDWMIEIGLTISWVGCLLWAVPEFMDGCAQW